MTMMLATTPPSATTADEKAVTAAVYAFVEAGDDRSIEAMEALLHPEFRVVAQTAGKAGLNVLPRATYVTLLKEGKLGGKPRALQLRLVSVQGDIAVASVILDGASGHFEGLLTLWRDNESWRIVQDAVQFTPRT